MLVSLPVLSIKLTKGLLSIRCRKHFSLLLFSTKVSNAPFSTKVVLARCLVQTIFECLENLLQTLSHVSPTVGILLLFYEFLWSVRRCTSKGLRASRFHYWHSSIDDFRTIRKICSDADLSLNYPSSLKKVLVREKISSGLSLSQQHVACRSAACKNQRFPRMRLWLRLFMLEI